MESYIEEEKDRVEDIRIPEFDSVCGRFACERIDVYRQYHSRSRRWFVLITDHLATGRLHSARSDQVGQLVIRSRPNQLQYRDRRPAHQLQRLMVDDSAHYRPATA